MIKLTADLYVRHYTGAYTRKGGNSFPARLRHFYGTFLWRSGRHGPKKGSREEGAVPMGTKKGHIALVGWLVGWGRAKGNALLNLHKPPFLPPSPFT